MGNGEKIVFDVGVNLEIIQSSVNDIKKVLDNLTPNTKGFKDLSKVIDVMTEEMDKFRRITAEGVTDPGQLKTAEKSLAKVNDEFLKAQQIVDRLKFSDIKLDDSQLQTFQKFQEQLTEISSKFNAVKEQVKQNILSGAGVRSFLTEMGLGDTLTKDFDAIIKKIDEKTEQLRERIAIAEDVLTMQKLQKKAAAAGLTSASATLGEKGFLAALAGTDNFSSFFQTQKKGDNAGKIGFRTYGEDRGQVKENFLRQLASTAGFKGAEIDQIIKEFIDMTYSKMSSVLQNDDRFKNILTKIFDVNGINSQIKATQASIDELKGKYEQMTNIQGQFNASTSSGGVVEQADAERQRQQEKVNAERKNAEQDAVNAAKGYGTLADSINFARSQLQTFTQQLQNTNAEMLRVEAAQRTFNSMKMTIANFMGFTQVLNLAKRAINEAAQHIQKLDSIMNQIAVVTTMTTADLWDQVDVYSQMAEKLGVSIEGAYEVSKIFYLQGLQTSDVMELTEETLKLAKIAGTDYATTTDYMTTALRGFKMEMSEASTVVDVYSALASHTAISQAELAEAMTRTASSAQAVGMSLEQTSAVISTMVAVTRETSSNIGSALKSISSRYGELTKDPTALLDSEGEAMSFNKVDEALKSIGISLQTTDHQFRNFYDVIVELGEAWDTLTSSQQRYEYKMYLNPLNCWNALRAILTTT